MEKSIIDTVPKKAIDLNMRAYEKGRELAASL